MGRYDPIKAVFFDLDDTLVLTADADEASHTAVSAALAQRRPPLDGAAVLAAWKPLFAAAPWDVTHQVPVEEWRAALWLQALRVQGVDDAALAAQLQDSFNRTRLSRFRLEAGVPEMLRELEAARLQLVIITNGHHHIQRAKLEHCAAGDAFSNIIVGGEEVLAGRPEKPDPSIFLKACALAGCQPHEAVHIGDSLKADIQGGINAGLVATVWVSRHGAAAPSDGPQPTFTVQHVTELTRCLRELSTAKDA